MARMSKKESFMQKSTENVLKNGIMKVLIKLEENNRVNATSEKDEYTWNKCVE